MRQWNSGELIVPYVSTRPLRGFHPPHSNLRGLSCPPQRLGLMVGAAAQNASLAQRGASNVATGASVGATVGSVIPGLGTAIGAGIGAAIGAIGSLFGPAKEGQAAVTWDDMVNKGYLGGTRGVGFDERYFGEALKGAMDKGKNVWGTKCGPDGHQNPDCFYSVYARAIAQGYLNHVVPVGADEPTVWNNVVMPWLQSGGGGYINWSTLANEPTQRLLLLAALDRYMNGLPITRANMPAYVTQASQYSQWSTPPLAVLIASLLQQPVVTPVETAAVPTSIVTPTAPPIVPTVAPTRDVLPIMAQPLPQIAQPPSQPQSIIIQTPQGPVMTQPVISQPSGFQLSPSLLLIGGVAVVLLLRNR